MLKVLMGFAVLMFAPSGITAADPKPEELASGAASDFMKALAEGKVDAMVKLTDTPFLPDGAKEKSAKRTLTDAKDVRKVLDQVVEIYRTVPKDKVMTAVLRVVPLAEALKKEPIEDKEVLKAVSDALGESGYLVFLGRKGDDKDKTEGVVVFVKVKGDRAFVVSPPLG